ncbi:MAG TPA: SUMF1/EgtB/PvdO family nonheme iron enzyme [Saprospiraceae bacterium]|nr:SUMF1/EgtB/PvdO family nonheme iron enzyme [Saprospiraceae bacterium]
MNIINYLIEKLPETIGTIVLGGGTALIIWFSNRVNRKKGEKEKTNFMTKGIDTFKDEYINDLLKRSSTLTFGDPSSWSTVGANTSLNLVTLEQVWTPLRVADSRVRSGKQGTHENMVEQNDGIDLKELIISTNESLLILGDPGSGKSTSLAYFAIEAAKKYNKGDQNHFPIWINLSLIKTESEIDYIKLLLSGVPEIDLALRRLGQEGKNKLINYLNNLILEGKALLLLDGLDEVKDHLLSEIRSAISFVVGLKNNTRIITSCRKFDYRQAIPNRKIPIVRELELLPYNKNEQRIYVERWYDAALKIGKFSPVQADELSEALVVELQSENLEELSSSPLLLALLTLIHSEEAKLPDTRAVLCDKAITYMLADSAKWRIREAGASTLATPPVLSLAIELAYTIHKSEEVANNEGSSISKNTIEILSTNICNIMANADTGRGTPSPNDLAQRFLKSHGLLVDIGNNEYKFSHRSFQEFLAGQYFAAGAHHTEAIMNCKNSHWREPFRLMSSFAGHEGQNLYYILTLIEELLKENESTQAVQIAAEMLTEIGRRRIALRKFHNILDESTGLWVQAKLLISKHVENKKLSLSERERSATVLGILGDQRFEKLNLISFVKLPKIKMNIGTSKLDSRIIINSGGSIGETRCVDFYEFNIGKYLVTNIEFKRFIEDDGYSNFDYWIGEFAKGWVSGDKSILDTIRNHWLSTVELHHTKEIRDGEIQIEKLEEESIERTNPRQFPFYWADRRFNQANQPVVGINLWEAYAYCVWLTQKAHQSGELPLDMIYSLPTEFEWERASRQFNDDRIYPWGDKWSDEKAHVSSNILNMRQPSPVGIYLESWKDGPMDMAGNVWEWTLSLFHPYDQKYDFQRLILDSLDERVVRGSSWYNTSVVAACSSRSVDRSYNLFYDVGFRIVSLKRDLDRY